MPRVVDKIPKTLGWLSYVRCDLNERRETLEGSRRAGEKDKVNQLRRVVSNDIDVSFVASKTSGSGESAAHGTP